MVRITVFPLYAQLSGDLPPHMDSLLYEELAYNTEGARWLDLQKGKHEGGWDRIQRFYNKETRRFRAGFVERVSTLLNFWHIPYEIIDEIPPLVAYLPIPLPETLFDKPFALYGYQERLREAILAHLRIVIWSVPRSGKTVTVAATLAELGVPKTIFLCADLSILEQTVKLFREFFPPTVMVGQAGDGIVERGDILVLTRQTACSAYNKKWKLARYETEEKEIVRAEDKLWIREFFINAEVVVVDECHEASSSQYRYLLRQTPQVRRVIGISGTPFREDNSDLVIEGAIGPLYPEGCADYDELVEQNFLLRPEFYIYELPRGLNSGKILGWAAVYKQFVVYGELRNRLIAMFCDRFAATNRTVLVLVRRKVHLKILQELIPYAVTTHGTDQQKLVWLQKLRDREFPVLITTLFRQGTDIPSLDGVINAEGGYSAIQAFQRLRCMTPFPGKKRAILIDFRNRERYLQKHSDRRIAQYESVKSFIIRKFKVTQRDQPSLLGDSNIVIKEITNVAQ
jgi:superfamily II DNA or RNA helicase